MISFKDCHTIWTPIFHWNAANLQNYYQYFQFSGKTESELIADLIEIHSSDNWLGDDTETSPAEMTSLDKDLMNITASTKFSEDEEDDHEASGNKGDPNCYECKVKYRDPSPKDLIMYLHALKYQVLIIIN